jgi:hypothetical protein
MLLTVVFTAVSSLGVLMLEEMKNGVAIVRKIAQG